MLVMAREGPELVEVRGRLVLREPALESLEPPEAQAQPVPE